MSRIGQQPIPIPTAVKVKLEGTTVTVQGPKGELSREFHEDMQLRQEEEQIIVTRPTDQPQHRALHGLTRALVANMVIGVTDGFSKTLELHGVGYRAEQKGANIQLSVGFSHTVGVDAPKGIKLEVDGTNRIRIHGVDKELVGQTAAEIRSVRPPEPYKGKGIRYEGEYVRRKAGKAGKTLH